MERLFRIIYVLVDIDAEDMMWVMKWNCAPLNISYPDIHMRPKTSQIN